VFGLLPVEYPSTRRLNASPEERAADITAAFSDTSITAVLSSIGGEDQIKVLRHLDADSIRANPKPFFGYSDNTNLLNYLWNLGIVGYHGGAVMVQLGRSGTMHPVTEASIAAALFTSGEYEVPQVEQYTDEEVNWADAAAATTPLPMQPAPPWSWHGPATRVTGPSWGGNLEILDWNLRAGTHIRPSADYAGAVFFVETSEELPSATYVYRVLMAMGERGLLGQFAAVLVARPKAWTFENRTSTDEKTRYAGEQAAAVLRAFDEYNPGVPIVIGLDFGHTDPQVVIPSGGSVTVDSEAQRVSVTY
jgi:muramoyltetrapeptide carboxypeptidase LdcA involved in peptidoglycan recycling